MSKYEGGTFIHHNSCFQEGEDIFIALSRKVNYGRKSSCFCLSLNYFPPEKLLIWLVSLGEELSMLSLTLPRASLSSALVTCRELIAFLSVLW